MFWLFHDRFDAGRQLAGILKAYAGRDDVIVLGLPRGGVPVAHEVATALGAPLDVLVVRKLGLPRQPELAMGAIASGGAMYLNEDVLRSIPVDEATVHAVERRERVELARRERLYRGKRSPPQVRGRTVIVVDDGLATGASMQAAVMALRSLRPARIVVAVPVAPADAIRRLDGVPDDFVCVLTASDFRAVGQFYRDFDQTTDAQVRQLLLDHAGKVPA
jgi:putative phosphoribosyl transferase